MASTPKTKKSNVLYSYKANEFEKYERSVSWYVGFSAIGILLMIYSIIERAPLMFVVFFLLFIIILASSQKDPQIIEVDITKTGIVLDKSRMFRYQDIESFGIFIDGPVRYISLYLEEGLLRYARIPLGKEDPEEIATLLDNFIVREDGKESLMSKLDHILKI